MAQIGRLPLGQVMSRVHEINLLNLTIEALYWITPMLNEYLGQVEPPVELRRDGMLAYADGTLWDPGSGKGLYRYNSATAAWVFIG